MSRPCHKTLHSAKSGSRAYQTHLIGTSGDLELLLLLFFTEPSPPRPLRSHRCRVESRLHWIHAAKVTSDALQDRTCVGGCHYLIIQMEFLCEIMQLPVTSWYQVFHLSVNFTYQKIDIKNDIDFRDI